METESRAEVLVGRYTLDEELGRSGAGMVWRATDTVLDRTVVVKVLRPALVDDPVSTARLATETAAVAGISAPGIARLLDTGADRGVGFLVREHVPGESLRAIVRRDGPLPPTAAVRILIGVLDALAAVHAAGVLHLDLKPENVIVETNGELRLTDVGIGAAISAAYGPARGVSILSLDAPAPEQRADGPVDVRTDVFLAGALLFELLTGAPPPAGRTPSLRDLAPGVPRSLASVALRAMAEQPEARFPDAGAFADALRPTLAHEVRTDTRSHEGHGILRGWLVVPALVVAAAVAAISIGIWIGRLELGGPLGVRPKQEEAEPTSSPRTASSLAAGILPLVTAIAYDPFGDGAENDAGVALAIDGDAGTAWRSENYFDPTMNNKPGVGLLFDLGETRTVTGFRLRVPHPGYTFGLAVGDDPEQLASSVEGRYSADVAMRRSIEPVQGRYVLLWVTSVVDVGDGNRAEVAEFQVIGR